MFPGLPASSVHRRIHEHHEKEQRCQQGEDCTEGTEDDVCRCCAVTPVLHRIAVNVVVGLDTQHQCDDSDRGKPGNADDPADQSRDVVGVVDGKIVWPRVVHGCRGASIG